MSRIFGFLKRRPRVVDQAVRFKTTVKTAEPAEAPKPAVAESPSTDIQPSMASGASYSRMEIMDVLERDNTDVQSTITRMVQDNSSLPHLLAVLEDNNFHTEYRVLQARYNVDENAIWLAYKELGLA